MSLRITIIINKQNCELLYNHCFPDVMDRNCIQCHYSTCTLHICWAEIKEYCIVLYCIVLYYDRALVFFVCLIMMFLSFQMVFSMAMLPLFEQLWRALLF